MVKVFPTDDMAYINGVISTPGMRKLASRPLEVPAELVFTPPAGTRMLKVVDDGTPVGFTALIPIGSNDYDLHLCLKTRGNKTKEAVSRTIDFAKYYLGAKSLVAIYGSISRSVTILCDHFGFKDDPSLRERYSFSGFEGPLEHKRLIL